MKSLIIGEQQAGVLADAVPRLVTAATAFGGEMDLLLLGEGAQRAASAGAALAGVRQVWVAEACPQSALLGVDVPLARQLGDYDAYLLATSSFGKDLAPRLAVRLGVEPLSDIVAIEPPDTFVRPIYAGNVLARVRLDAPRRILTVRTSVFAPAAAQAAAPVMALTLTCQGRVTLLEHSVAASDRPELTTARVVVAGGRGVGSREQFALIEALADKLGGAVGASRAAVDAGLAGNDRQVGQTGKVVAPDLYIAVGISGAIQHLAGIQGARVIVAINKDPDAPIFQIADYGLVGDLTTLLPALLAKL